MIPYKMKTLMKYLKRKTQNDELLADRREIRHGLLSVGIKLHCLKLETEDGFHELFSALGGKKRILERNYYQRTYSRFCLILPPVGNAESAIELVEAIETATETQIFGNADFQIQVCSPGRLEPMSAGLLTIGFCLGSDILRGFWLNDLETTFSNNLFLRRGRRLTLYDGQGRLDRNFEWWDRERGQLRIMNSLPFTYERTDVLSATSRLDIRNINLLATLLIHAQQGWYWSDLGNQLMNELFELIDNHELLHVLDAPWVYADEEDWYGDERFKLALNELMVIAFYEADMLDEGRKLTNGLLESVRDLFTRYYGEVIVKSACVREVPR